MQFLQNEQTTVFTVTNYFVFTMKTKIVLWGTDANNGKVLIAMELRPEHNKVDLFTFPSAIVNDEFTTQMMDKWRNGEEVAFPEGHTHIERELTVADSILPDDLKADRTEVINRAQTEWHFIVLSSKLNQAYHSELEDYKDKVEKMTAYDASAWDNLKAFWGKVQGQVQERMLSREHADLLRDGINDLFTKLKDLRTSLNNEFEQKSSEVHTRFMATLDNIEERIKTNPKAPSIFEDLKKMQADFRNVRMTREHNNQIWARIDDSFKAAKTGKFGEQAINNSPQDSSAAGRVQSRLDGLNAAIQKMEITLKRENDELDFQKKKIATTDGQLEAQIRQAKMRMVQERATSIQEKLNGMYETRAEVEKSLAGAKEKDAKRAEKQEVAPAVAVAAAVVAAPVVAEVIEEVVVPVVEEPIAEVATPVVEIAEEAVVETSAPTVEEAAAPIASFAETAEIAIQDTVDTVKAVAEVVGEKLEDFIEELTGDKDDDKEDDKEA